MANALKTLFTNCANAIRETLPDVGKMSPNSFPDRIREVAQAGGGSNLVKYVTFMSWDGLTELFKMPVLSGDDCKDPITHGDIETPTKESTNTENFAFSGWSLTSGGSANSSALKNITEDVIVYASFTASVRYYTVNFYDGTTLLETVEVTYGANATEYIPTKEGYLLGGLSVDITNITSDTDVVITWVLDDGYIHDDWDVISARCSDGTALNYYSVGDKISVPIEFPSGTENYDFMIVATEFISGTKLAFMCLNALDEPQSFNNTSQSNSMLYFSFSSLKDYLNKTLLTYLPQKMQNALKSVNMPYASASCKIYVPTNQCLHGSNNVKFEYFKDASSTEKIRKTKGGTNVEYWLASTEYSIGRVYYTTKTGSSDTTTSQTTKKYIVPVFFV